MGAFIIGIIVGIAAIIGLSYGVVSCDNASSNDSEKISYNNNNNNNNNGNNSSSTSLTYGEVEISISKYGDSNELQTTNSNYIVLPTTKDEFSIEGLTQNKIVLVKIKFNVSNTETTDKVFDPYFTISNSKGYSLSSYSSDTSSADIQTLNEGTSSESIKVSGLSKTIKAQTLNSIVTYVFAYQCNKTSTFNISSQDWSFYDRQNNNKSIHYAHVDLTFPSYYEEISAPTYTYNDNSISICSTDENVKYANIYFDGKLNKMTKENEIYTFKINKSGTYTIKLRSDDLLVEDYTHEFKTTVLEDVSSVEFETNKYLSFKEVSGATTYDVVIKDSNGNIIEEFSTSSNSNIDIRDRIQSYTSGKYSVSVYANSSENLIFRSVGGTDRSFSKLSTPDVKVKNKTLSWESVDGATSYFIYKYNDTTKEYEYLNSTTNTTYKDTNFTYNDKLYVVALSSTNNVFNSDASDIVTIVTA